MMMENGAEFVNGHYQLPLPLRNPALIMPNNRTIVEKRANYLKRRFTKNKKFFEDYQKFNNDILQKGYARVASEIQPYGKTYYIPHHGIYHRSKPGKIRVVFDCSAEFNDKSINKELLSGPDLTNHLVGVLIRFCQEQVAVIGDIESMFYQVWVSEEHRSLLRFLWSKDGDLKNLPTDHEIGRHVFGDVSSPCCSNYALNKKLKYGLEAADTLSKNFYVDDMLKSVASVPEAITLVKIPEVYCSSSALSCIRLVKQLQFRLKIL